MFRLRLLLFLLCCGLGTSLRAQIAWPSPEVERMYEQARTAMNNGNARQAAALFKQITELAPDVPIARRDLAQAHALQGRHAEVIEALKPLFDAGTADEEAYRIAALSYTAQRDGRKARAILRSGLREYPSSGPLYKELGTALDADGDREEALSAWLEGIRRAPGYHVNYYEAAHAYVFTTKLVWCILYAEVFLATERRTPRAADARKMLLAAYRRFYFPTAADARAAAAGRASDPSSFEGAVEGTLRSLLPVVSDGITTESLTMLRTRFILEWNRRWAARYPFALFRRMDEMLRAGHFEAYNHALFAQAENANAAALWEKMNPDAISAFESWAAANPLRVEAGEGPNDGRVKGIFLKREMK